MFVLFNLARAQFPQVPIARTAKSALFNYFAVSESDLLGMNRTRERVRRADLMLKYLAGRGIHRHSEKPVYVPTHIAVDFITDCEQAIGQKPFTPPRNFVKDTGVLTLRPDGEIGYARWRSHTVADLHFAPGTRRFYYKETGAPPIPPMPEETKVDFKIPKARIVFNLDLSKPSPEFGEATAKLFKKIEEASKASYTEVRTAHNRIHKAFDRWCAMPNDQFYPATADAIDLLRTKVGVTVLENTPDHLAETVAEALERLIDLEAAARAGSPGAAQAQKYVGEYGLDLDMIGREATINKQAAEMAEAGKKAEENAAAKARRTYEANARAEYLSAIGKLDMARRKLRKIGIRPDISIDSSAGHVHCAGFLREETK